ncbi:hypothetical protein RFI_05179 [Reticulomyxa filosa]|uniref:Uncharacterized protein n=1 Tax=Reticulomyxa filosa TaxID=46433 RepID=X6P1D5_RETFI|nr:hypothetical protein RFI_05179 [Reticulomyxa filosa]|eukprot:ETO31938.1 hypothetical protein RFI_05179 [Reticulomyxa filosa]
MWKYVQCPQFCNNVRRLSLVQFKNSRICIFKSTLIIDPMQSNESIHTLYTLIFKSKYRFNERKKMFLKKKGSLRIARDNEGDEIVYMVDLIFLKKHSDLEVSKQWLGCGCWTLQKFMITIRFDWDRYVGNVELLQLYILFVQNSVFVPICPFDSDVHIIVYFSLANAQINLQILFDIAISYDMAQFKLNMDGRGWLNKWTGQLRLLATKNQSSLHGLAPALMVIEALFAQIRMCDNTPDEQSNCESVVMTILFCTSALLAKAWSTKALMVPTPLTPTISHQQSLKSTHDQAPIQHSYTKCKSLLEFGNDLEFRL